MTTRPPQACWAVSLAAEAAHSDPARCVLRLAAAQPGYLGGEGRVTYWDSVEAIAAWRARAEQLARQGRGADDAAPELSFLVSRIDPRESSA
ncbi:antibiotic biosynthesis monooxygenase family protein [Chromobacterium subtsugae]|uniref:antibiotic biosynthesis monooxygenase family protein n=1 Tax=Chromobacterium subtsugae TaxID=251747 RepID=UPI00064117CC|nr:hypothetical protein [Chromobacterium subtsugae]